MGPRKAKRDWKENKENTRDRKENKDNTREDWRTEERKGY